MYLQNLRILRCVLGGFCFVNFIYVRFIQFICIFYIENQPKIRYNI